jgi:hypothetical protein
MSRLAILALALLAGACGPDASSVLEDRRPQTEAALARIEDTGARAATYHDAIADIRLPQEDRLRFGDGANAAIAQDELFGKGEPRLDLGYDAAWLTQVRAALQGRLEGLDGRSLAARLDALEAIRYLVVVRTRLLAAPEPAGEGLFSPGLWQGEVMVFQTATGEFLGGASLTASNTDEVDVNVHDPVKFLNDDLRSNVRAAVRDALRPHTEGKTPGVE